MSTPSAGTAATASSPFWSRTSERWRALSLRARVHLVLLPLIMAAAVAHNAVLWTWYIEDAAISFAYARNLADGEGLVPFPGGERVEGYSNPTWVALLALFELFGAPSEASARWIQVVLAALTVPIVYLLGKEAAPREDSDVPIVGAALLAGSAQFAIWGSSGLENGLFNFLLAGGLWRLAVEVRTGRWPWSAAWFFLLAISRPEAILYAAVGGFASMVFHLHARRGLTPTFKWLATFFVPFLGYHAWRYNYFAWAWPNTYYAKLGDHRDPKPFAWDRAGWKYVRDWAETTKMGYFLPVLLLGVTGGQGWRALAAIVTTTIVGVVVLLGTDQQLLLPVVLGFTYAVFYTSIRIQSGRPSAAITWAGLLLVAAFVGVSFWMRSRGAVSKLPSPDLLRLAPPYVLLLVFVTLPLTSVGRRGWQARAACWGTAGVAVFFACYALGDWMKGFRWLSMATVPGSVLLACGAYAVGEVAQTLFGSTEERWTIPGWAASLAVAIGMIPPNVQHTLWLNSHRETSPYHVRERVEYKTRVRERLFVEGPIEDLDIDQGAHLYWSDHRMLDIAGLVDVPMAHHKFARPFVREYVFLEHKPELAHVHGGWANSSKIPTHAEWRRDYFEIPGYPAAKNQLHPGNFIRRDLVTATAWKEGLPDRRVVFGAEGEGARPVLVGWDVPSREAGRGRRFYVEVGLDGTRPFPKGEHFRVLAFLTDGQRVATWDLPPGYDWLKPHEWRSEELFHGRFSFELPNELPEGRYELGFVAFGPDGLVLPASGAPEGAVVGGIGGEPARFAVGEIRFADALTIVTPEELGREAQADHDRAIAQANAGGCEEAEQSWWLARMHHPRATTWVADRADGMSRALAECWARKAVDEPDRAVAHVVRAREWDHHAPSLPGVAHPLAEARWAEGLEAREQEAWESAYQAFSDVTKLEPWRAWARRYAEEARAYRLGLDPETKAREEADKVKRQEDLAKRREQQEGDAPAGPDEAGDAPEAPDEAAAPAGPDEAGDAQAVEGG